MASMLWGAEGRSEAATNWQLRLSAGSLPGARSHLTGPAPPSPGSSFSCCDSWASCVCSAPYPKTQRPKDGRLRHTTKGGGNEHWHGFHSISAGLGLMLVLPPCPNPLYPHRLFLKTCLLDFKLQHQTQREQAMQTLLNQLLHLCKVQSCVYTCVYLCVYLCVSIYTYAHVYAHTHMCTFVYICTQTYVYVCACECLHLHLHLSPCGSTSLFEPWLIYPEWVTSGIVTCWDLFFLIFCYPEAFTFNIITCFSYIY